MECVRATTLEESFRIVYREHAPMVRRALVQLGVEPSMIEDAVQDVFVVLLRRVADYDPERSLKNWLWGIARGVASTYRRSRRRRDRLVTSLPFVGSVRPALEEDVAKAEAATIIEDFLGTLDEDKCAVFVMSELEGRSGPEISQLLNVNVNTVYARLRAARQRFDAAVARHRPPSLASTLAALLPVSWIPKPVAVAAAALVALAIPLSQSIGDDAVAKARPMIPSAATAPTLSASRSVAAPAVRESIVAAGAIGVLVVDDRGGPLQHARVCAAARSGKRTCIESSESGEAWVDGLAMGEHRVVASVGSETADAGWLTLTPETSDVVVVLEVVSAPPVRRRRSRTAGVQTAREEQVEVASTPPLLPPGETIVARPPKARPASLVAVRPDFIGELQSLAIGL